MKRIVTHLSPDVDAVTSVWLLKRFLKGWDSAEILFVPAGKTLNDDPVDSDPQILHVDTGLGILDHHQVDDDSCAAVRTQEFIKRQKAKGNRQKLNDEALGRLVDVVNDIDHFREVYYPNPSADFYDFSLASILDGWRFIYGDNHQKLVELGIITLDGIYKKFQDKVWAEKEIKTAGLEFKTKWGNAIGIETINDEVVRVAQKLGFIIAVRKDPKKNFVRVKALPNSKVDLTQYYNKLKKLDPEATWYLHVSHKMLLNGSMKNPQSRPTKLTLKEIIEVLKK